MIDDPTMTLPTAPTAAQPGVMPQPTLDPAFEDKRKRIAQALMMQRGMGKQTPMGGLANTALQAWNMARKAPTMAPPGTIQTPLPPDVGYPIGGGGG